MKMIRTLIPTFLLLAFLAAPGFTQTVRAQDKIATVDLKKLFNGFWKTKTANTTLDARKADLRKDLKDMADGIDKAQADYKELLVQANDPAISDTERARRKQLAADKNKEISDHKLAYEQYSRQAESQMQDMVQRMNSSLLTEIQEHIATQAKLGGYSLVLNTTSEAVLYSRGDNDITPQVLSNLNAGAVIDIAPAATNSAAMPLTIPKNGP